MPRIVFVKGKLIPLRRFAVESLYSVAYLSQIVQRKKLKAQKVGRNYFTKLEWFEEYLELHARDEMRESYNEYFYQLEAENEEQTGDKLPQNEETIVNYFKLKYAAIFAAVFVLLISAIALLFSPFMDSGRVAGEEENATSTILDLRSKN